jgi:hypothetical protein
MRGQVRETCCRIFLPLIKKITKAASMQTGDSPFIAFSVPYATVVRLGGKFSGCMPERAEKTISGHYPDMVAVIY